MEILSQSVGKNKSAPRFEMPMSDSRFVPLAPVAAAGVEASLWRSSRLDFSDFFGASLNLPSEGSSAGKKVSGQSLFLLIADGV